MIKGIYLVADYDLVPDGARLLDIVQASARGGVGVVQLRAKRLDTRPMLELARAMVAALEPFRVPLILNDRADVALASGAQGLHVGQSDLPVEDCRRILGEKAIIGLSVETMAQVEEANRLPLDYVAASPVFNTPTKTDTAPAWGLDGLAKVAQASRWPVCAIGGINEGNAGAVAKAGAVSLAVVSAICLDPNPELATRKLVQVMNDGRA